MMPGCFLARCPSIQAATRSSHGKRSASVSGIPACILAMFDSGWSESPSSNGQPSRAESSSAIVDLPDPDTPMITRIGGLPRWARALSRRWTPAASATKTGSARLMKSPLSTTPTIRLMRSSSRAGSAMRPKSQSRMRLPLSVTKGAPDDMRARALAPSTSSDSRVASSPKATTSTGTRCLCTKSVHQLAAVDDDREAMARGRDNLLAQQGSAQSLDQIERAALHFVSAIDREIDLAMLAERGERNVRRLRLCCRTLRRGNADEAQALPMTPRERFDRESRRRAAAKPDDHVILDQLHRGLGGGALESVLISAGRGRSRIHDVTAAAATLARISAIALA